MLMLVLGEFELDAVRESAADAGGDGDADELSFTFDMSAPMDAISAWKLAGAYSARRLDEVAALLALGVVVDEEVNEFRRPPSEVRSP